LKPYLLGEHKLITRIPELTELGLILLQNKNTNKYTLLSVTSLLDKAWYNNDLLYGDLEYLKSYFFLDKFHDELELGITNSIENILVFNLQEGEYYYRPYQDTFEKYKERMLTNKFPMKLTEQVLPKLEDNARLIIRAILADHKSDTKEMQTLTDILNPLVNMFYQVPEQKLLEIQAELREKFPRLVHKNILESLSFVDDVEYIYALVSSIIVVRRDFTLVGDAVDLKNYALSFAD
jgi:hypothetical protein